MDKGRHPYVIRIWTVERTKVPYRPAQPTKARPTRRQISPASQRKANPAEA
jgi:hypothetical protein